MLNNLKCHSSISNSKIPLTEVSKNQSEQTELTFTIQTFCGLCNYNSCFFLFYASVCILATFKEEISTFKEPLSWIFEKDCSCGVEYSSKGMKISCKDLYLKVRRI